MHLNDIGDQLIVPAVVLYSASVASHSSGAVLYSAFIDMILFSRRFSQSKMRRSTQMDQRKSTRYSICENLPEKTTFES